MSEMPDFIRRAIEAQGKVDPDQVLALAEDAIPPDDVEQDWRHALPSTTQEPLPGGDVPPVVPEPEQTALDLDVSLTERARIDRDVAMRRVDQAADPEWKDLAYDALLTTARAMQEFISDDVWETGNLPPTREDRALGPVFRRAASNGICVKTGELRPSVRSHLSGKPVWRSLIYAGTAR